ncbi:hypothetical protein BSP239C_02695 [Brevibacterium sp. 239c]|uniref:hypothetical protein n=1 Tax=Brevibacterium sp. 239c TaxID=1965356 RepID=UPI000C5FB930|nr:hypothetical protein [Brevibacterium sp. 239c]SMX96013.1 hypothetical protein BSP239C_02695 [Brevibacterium sp. 239c]
MLTATESGRRPKVGPPLPPIAIATVALFMASLILPTVLAKGATFPSPYGDADIVVGYFQNNPTPVLITALLQFAASIPLVIFTATASVRLNHLGVCVPGPTIGLVGGILSAALLQMSALLTWTLTRPEILEHAELIRVLHDLAFITGGPGFIVPSGLLIAGIAVPGLIAGLLPRWLAWAGLVIAGLAMIALLAIAFPALSILLPIVRFPTLAWLVITAFQLPSKRNSVARKDTP